MTKPIFRLWGIDNPARVVLGTYCRRRAIALVAAAFFAMLLPFDASARSPGRVVILVAGGISIRDLVVPGLPNISRLLATGSSGLMNVRTGRPNKLIEPAKRLGMEPGCLAIGAGAMAVGGAEVRRAANANQVIGHISAGQIWSCRTGQQPANSEVVHTEVALIQRANQAATYRAKPGLLSSALSAAGIKCAVIGNSSIPGEVHGESSAIAMDLQGLVAYGEVSSPKLTQIDRSAPFGVCTNLDYIAAQVDRVLGKCRFVVIDVGDTYRADLYAEYCTDAQARALKRWAVGRLDKVVGRIASKIDFSADTLILLSPAPQTFTELAEERLTPIVVCGPDFRGGILTSPSTRRKGLVTICDVAPTVLRALGLTVPAEMTGRPMHAVHSDHPTDFLLNLNFQASLQGQRQVLVRAASVLQSLVVVFATMSLVLGSSSGRRLASWATLFPVSLTLAVLYAPILYTGGLLGTTVVILVVTFALVALFGRVFRTPIVAFAWLCGLLVASILVDLLRGGLLVSSSVAGYGMLEGARYYGLGNELMGSLLGAGLFGAASAIRSLNKYRSSAVWALPLTLALIFVFVGWPSLGANAGGAISTAAALVGVVLALSGRTFSLKGIALLIVAAVLGGGALFAADFLRSSAAQSHIGRLIEAAAGGKLADVVVVAQRKLALNLMLVSTSVWSKLLGLSIAASAVIYLVSRSTLSADSKVGSKIDSVALKGGAVAVFAAFIFNDSGVLAAASCAVVLWSYMALWYHDLAKAS